MDISEEKALVERILQNDEDAFLSLYQAYRRRLEHTAIHFLGSASPDIEDVLQQTFMACLPKLRDFRFECSLYTWLNHFTVNFCFQALNKSKKSLPTETKQLEAWSAPQGPQDPLKRVLHEEIEKLEPGQQELIRLKDLEGRTYVEIAEILKLAAGTVMSRHFKARQDLGKRLKARKGLQQSFWKQA